jgi:putative membrane protein
MHLKLVLVALLIGYHIYCGRLISAFARDENRKSDRFFRWFNDAPRWCFSAESSCSW